MINWNLKFLHKLKSVEIVPEIYTRFKDDITIVTESLERGSTFENNKIIVDGEKKIDDASKSDSKVTMEVIQELAQSINPMIKLTTETPCNFKDGKIPILDIKVEVNSKENNRIDFEFYQKPTKNQRVILASSALSHSKKRTILTQECLRRLRNTKVELGIEVQKKHLDVFMIQLKNSGYDKKFRKEIICSSWNAFEKMIDNDKNGIIPLYRPRSWNKEARNLQKSMKKSNWWNAKSSKIQYKSVMFVTPTPGEVLMKSLQKRELELN